MMRVTLEDGRVFEIDKDKQLNNVEMMAVERTTGWSLEEFQAKLGQSSVMAVTAFVWVMAKRTDPALRFDDVVFDLSAVENDDPVEAVEVDPKGSDVSA